jgi:hypothetical protein
MNLLLSILLPVESAVAAVRDLPRPSKEGIEALTELPRPNSRRAAE